EAHSDPRLEEVIVACEELADRVIDWSNMLSHRALLRELIQEMLNTRSDTSDLSAARTVQALTGREFMNYKMALEAAQHRRGHRSLDFMKGCRTEVNEQIKLARDIFGNPFRPVSFDPEWRTSTVVSLARSMYESRNFAAMPILSDALQDAGCDHTDIINH